MANLLTNICNDLKSNFVSLLVYFIITMISSRLYLNEPALLEFVSTTLGNFDQIILYTAFAFLIIFAVMILFKSLYRYLKIICFNQNNSTFKSVAYKATTDMLPFFSEEFSKALLTLAATFFGVVLAFLIYGWHTNQNTDTSIKLLETSTWLYIALLFLAMFLKYGIKVMFNSKTKPIV